jgi:hypothetical protein
MFWLFIESAADSYPGQDGSLRTGVAVANNLNRADSVLFNLVGLDGSSRSGSLALPPNGQISLFVDQIPGFANLPQNLQGVLRISAMSGSPISVVGVRGRYNERQDFLTATMPAIDDKTMMSQTEMFFPHVVDGGAYTTEFVLIGASSAPSKGTLRFFSQTGQPLDVVLR